MKTVHVLKMSCGVTVTATFDEETADFSCRWRPAPPWKPSKARKVLAEYEPWRDAIFEAWAERTGKKVLMVTL